ncbi:MAG: MltA domain-containing protein [Aestuariivirga sp.]|nr:MltA domain-containing protein [Aestuariivirga sp.]
MDQGAPAASLLEPIGFEALPGWPEHDHSGALVAFRLSCREILDTGTGFSRPVRLGGQRSSWSELCGEALAAADGRRFFESRFRPFRVRDPARPEGLFTGYFEPEVAGSRWETPVFRVPIYRRPPDLVAFPEAERAGSGPAFGRWVDGVAKLYFTRREIEEGALAGQGLELVYLADWADAFFIHVQGSGRVRLTDGGTMRLTYEAKSGLPYTGIGGLLVDRGILSPEAMSMQAIRAWMAGHPQEARALMWENQSFIFFREAVLTRPELGALGAQHVQLTPRRSLAVDRSWWMFGTPVWLDAEVPAGDEGGMRPFRQLLIAQDTGSAIRGLARGDVYWGFGEEAARIAGPMKSQGRMTVLLPIPVAEELGLP